MSLEEILSKKNQKVQDLNEMIDAIRQMEEASIEIPITFKQIIESCEDEIRRLDWKENQLMFNESKKHIEQAFNETAEKIREIALPKGLHIFNLTVDWDDNTEKYVITDFEIDDGAKTKIKKLIYLLQEKVECVKQKSENKFQLYLIDNVIVNVRSQMVRKDIGTEKFLYSVNVNVFDEPRLDYLLFIVGDSSRFVLFPKEYWGGILETSFSKFYPSNNNPKELLFDIDVANSGLKVRDGELIPFPSEFIYDLDKKPHRFPSFR